jgi:hypothetical protein
VLMRVVRIGFFFKILGIIFYDVCNNTVVPKGVDQKYKTPNILEGRQFYGIKEMDILERISFKNYMVKVWLKVCLIAH